MTEANLQLQDLIRGVAEKHLRRMIETTERLLREDLALIGIDWAHLLAADRMPDRITVAQQQTSDGGYLYRGLILDNDLVIDHLWQYPFEPDPGMRRRLIGFVFSGSEAERVAFARSHTLDTRVVIRADPEKLRGIRVRLVNVLGDSYFGMRGREYERCVQAQHLVDHLNRVNGWPAVSPYGD